MKQRHGDAEYAVFRKPQIGTEFGCGSAMGVVEQVLHHHESSFKVGDFIAAVFECFLIWHGESMMD